MDWEASVSGVTSEEVCFQKLATVRAHQQPITVLDSEGARVLTGSQDHTLRVFQKQTMVVEFTNGNSLRSTDWRISYLCLRYTATVVQSRRCSSTKFRR